MDRIYSEMTSLQYENRALRKEIESFRNGERYKKLQQDHHRVIAGYERKISQLKKDLENERAMRKRVRNLWIDQCKKDYDSYQAELEVKNRKMEKLEKEKLEIRKKYEETIASLIQNYEEKLEEKQNVIAELTARVEHAEAILAHDGTNTGTPTSQTPPGKKKVIPNSRRSSGKPKGGQKGHPQHELEAPAKEEINEEVPHEIESGDVCPSCGSERLIYTGRSEDKYEYEVKIKVIKRKHTYYVYECSDCGELVRTGISPNHRAKCQYGAGVQAIALSLMNTANASMNKTAAFLSGLTGDEIHPSEGYIAKLQKRAAKMLQPFREDLRNYLLTKRVIYWDDTVIFINTERSCFRFYGDEHVAFYTAHLHKDLAGINDDKILPLLTAETYVMHDHNTVNYNRNFFFRNLECAQHLERDCQKNTNDTGHDWSSAMKELISVTIRDRNDAIALQNGAFEEAYIAAFYRQLDKLLQLGWDQHNADNEKQEKYGAPFERSLLNRIEAFRSEYCAWIHDFSLPTTNNLSERSLRHIKTKMKVSGQFESEAAAQNFAIIRTYLETCHRNKIDEIDALTRLCEGKPYTVAEIFDMDKHGGH